jgi:quercetin dioxygenase-like cupin family protein
MAQKSNFALHCGAQTKTGSVVYFEPEPGCELGNHIGNTEEIAYVVSGTGAVEANRREKRIKVKW